MGALDRGHFDVELENKVKLGYTELEFEQEPETLAIEAAVRVLLQGLGEDINREGLRKTPFRVAKALREGTRGYKQKVEDIVQGALFPEVGLGGGNGHAGGASGLVIVRDLDLFSYCESCLLPFQVKCHVGYIPSGQKVVGLSKLSRVADVFAKRLQDPQRLADEICSALHRAIKAEGVAVALQCLHIHFPSLEKALSASNHHGCEKVMVSSGSGVLENRKSGVWSDFLGLLKCRGMDGAKQKTRDTDCHCWCPSLSSSNSEVSSAYKGMVSAVASILNALGEDPSRKELLGTPNRFVKWLMNFESTHLEMKLDGHALNSLKPNGQTSGNEEEIHSELNLPFWSQCEHHLLPFLGVVHIGYFSPKGETPLGKSHLQAIVHFYGFKLQMQERLTRQIAETVSPLLGGDVMVVVEANHTCMISRGIEKFGSNTATISALGRFSTDPAARATVLQSIPNSTTTSSFL